MRSKQMTDFELITAFYEATTWENAALRTDQRSAAIIAGTLRNEFIDEIDRRALMSAWSGDCRY